MSDEAVENGGPGEEQAQPGGRGGLMKTVLGVVVGIAVGSGVGFAGAPMLAGDGSDAHAVEAESGGHGKKEKKKGGGHGGGEEAEQAVHLVENMVLNPAGTGGSRYLMVTVAAEADAMEAKDELDARAPEVRDRLMGVLQSKTVEELTDLAGRDSLKVELAGTLNEMLHAGEISAIYLPTFVIQ